MGRAQRASCRPPCLRQSGIRSTIPRPPLSLRNSFDTSRPHVPGRSVVVCQMRHGSLAPAAGFLALDHALPHPRPPAFAQPFQDPRRPSPSPRRHPPACRRWRSRRLVLPGDGEQTLRAVRDWVTRQGILHSRQDCAAICNRSCAARSLMFICSAMSAVVIVGAPAHRPPCTGCARCLPLRPFARRISSRRASLRLLQHVGQLGAPQVLVDLGQFGVKLAGSRITAGLSPSPGSAPWPAGGGLRSGSRQAAG